MSEKEIFELQEKIDEGLQLAEQRMLQEKALRDECVIVQNADGVIQHIPAKQVIAEHSMSL
ncbi:MAG: ribosome recycling factor [Bacteroidales bacterium]|nr:ribosome recycling factor [Bacteroidales bacterium]